MDINQELEDYGELVLVLGDFHIPTRKEEISENFKNLLGPNKVQKIICTGNIGGEENLNWLKTLSPNIYMVKGDCDTSDAVPDYLDLKIGQFSIGVTHGHGIIPWGDTDALYNYQKTLNIDILISGHTHELNAQKVEGKYFLNPGSITGAYSSIKPENTPSFMLLDVQSNSVFVYLYQEIQGEIKIEKAELVKEKQ